MSKDTINPKRWILTQEQLDAYGNWLLEASEARERNFDTNYNKWLLDNPCPLPNPVEIPSDEEIDKYTTTSQGKLIHNDGIEIGMKLMRKLIFNKQ